MTLLDAQQRYLALTEQLAVTRQREARNEIIAERRGLVAAWGSTVRDAVTPAAEGARQHFTVKKSALTGGRSGVLGVKAPLPLVVIRVNAQREPEHTWWGTGALEGYVAHLADSLRTAKGLRAKASYQEEAQTLKAEFERLSALLNNAILSSSRG